MIEYTDYEELAKDLRKDPLSAGFMLPRHAALSLGVDLATIQRMVADGRLVEIKFGDAVGIRYKEVVELEKKGR